MRPCSQGERTGCDCTAGSPALLRSGQSCVTGISIEQETSR